MINSFKNQYAFLSNFYTVSLTFECRNYPTVEHAYQSSKTFDNNHRHWISFLPGNKAGVAKIRGQGVKLRPDWEKVKVDIMKKLLCEQPRVKTTRLGLDFES